MEKIIMEKLWGTGSLYVARLLIMVDRAWCGYCRQTDLSVVY